MHVNYKKLIIFMFIFIFLYSVHAQPPQFTTTTSELGYDIIIPKEQYIKVGDDFTFHIHVLNASGYPINNKSTDCFLHVYNNTGNHIINEKMIFDSNNIDFYTFINHTTISAPGDYGYIAWCNNSIQGGYFSEALVYTLTGKADKTNMTIPILLLFLFSVLFYFVIGGINLYMARDNDEKLSFWLGILSISLGIITFAELMVLLYLDYISVDLSGILWINAYVIAFLMSGIGTITTFILIVRMFDDKTKKKFKKWD